ncbi:MAG: hypothetical protein J2P51_06970 [Hyphomicrobiaceae bacterium]|nr:hypothetical protein [Hyphomicrobiaceae bacterium]
MRKIIDGHGRVWHDTAAASVAVEENGGVALRRRRSGAMEVRFRPNSVKPMAVLRVVKMLETCERVVLVPGFANRDEQLISHCAAAIERLTQLTNEAQSSRARDFYSRRHWPGAAAADVAFGPLHETWCAARGRRSCHLLEAVRDGSSGRYLEVIPREGATKLVMAAVGNGYSLYGEGWKSVAVGGLFEDMPDFDYACWAAQAYREAFRTAQPVFEDVAATVRLRHAGPLRLEYRRVILPIGNGEQPTLLLGATLQQSVRPLALGADDEVRDVLQ